MTEIKKGATVTNPRGAGRKPKPPGERKVKISVSLSPEAVATLTETGGGILSKGIEMKADQFVFSDSGALIGTVHLGPGDKPFQAWSRSRTTARPGNAHKHLGMFTALEDAVEAVRAAFRRSR